MNVWLDDMRKNPDDYEWAKTYFQAVKMFEENDVEVASLDHDLDSYNYGYDYEYFDGHKSHTGLDFVLWIKENDKWPTVSLALHSDYEAGKQRMRAVIEEFGPYLSCTEIQYNHNQFAASGYIYTKEELPEDEEPAKPIEDMIYVPNWQLSYDRYSNV